MTDFCRGHLDDAGLDCLEGKYVVSQLNYNLMYMPKIHFQGVRVVLSGLLVAMYTGKVVWRCVRVKHGAQSVMTYGIRMMLM